MTSRQHYKLFDAAGCAVIAAAMAWLGIVNVNAWAPAEPEKPVIETISYTAPMIPEEEPEVEDDIVEPVTEEEIIEEPERVYLGEYTLTGYCPCKKCCGKSTGMTASGVKAIAGTTIGTDWNTLPCGTEIEIEGVGTRTVQDKVAKSTATRYNGRIIDLYCDTHAEALKVGRKVVKVWA